VTEPFLPLDKFSRNEFRRLIRKKFPNLEKELEQQGLGSYAKEVAIDIDYVVDPIPVQDTGHYPDTLHVRIYRAVTL